MIMQWWGNGCSSHMNGNKAYLSDFEGFQWRLIGLLEVIPRQCLFTEYESLYLYYYFKLLMQSQVVIRALNKIGGYSLDLKNIVPSGDLSLSEIRQSKEQRCDNGTEFKNYAMNEFCAKKGIKREFSVARTPQQNGVAERKNRTLIEAARTMTKRVEENLHINFLEGQPNVTGTGPNWMFDLDFLTNFNDFIPDKDSGKGCCSRMHNEQPFEMLLRTRDKPLKKKRGELHLKRRQLNLPLVAVTSTGANADESSFVYLGGKIPIDASTLPNADEILHTTVQPRGKIQKASSAQHALVQRSTFTKTEPETTQGIIRTVCLHVFALKKTRIYHNPLMDESWVEVCKEECSSSSYSKVWILVDLPFGKEVYVDDIIFGSTKKSMCTEFEEVMHKIFQMSSMGELIFFLGLQEASLTENLQLVMSNFFGWKTHILAVQEADIVANSTTEAEYVAAAHCCGQWSEWISMDLRMDRCSPGKYYSSMVFHMANLKYSGKHNKVAFLKKLNESVGFTEEVDFLKGISLKYALTHNPTIYDSLVKQFWQTATVRTLANGTQQLVASIDSKEYTITEASVRSKLQLADAIGIHNLFDAEIYAGLATLEYVTQGDIVPLLPAMLAGAAVDQGEGSAQPAEPHHTPVDPISSTSQPPHSPPHPSPPPHSPPHPSPPPHSPLPSPPHPSPLHQSPPHSPPHFMTSITTSFFTT
ncbi:putative ribonuclease H-like domain-containing protein [Tanacetum coccineum]